MNTNSKRLGIYLAIMTALTALATTLRTVACMSSLDYGSGFFNDKTLITTSNITVLLTALGMLSYLFTAPRIKLIASFSTSATYVTTGVLGVATAFLGARIFGYALNASAYPFFSTAGAITQNGIATIIGIPCAILAFLSIAHHFFNAFITESKAEIRAYFAIASIAFLALYSILIYMDYSLSLGESTKALRLVAFLTGALFFLYEARISLGREMWRIYTAFGLIAASVCAYASIPAIITYFVKGALVSHANSRSLASLEEYIFLLILSIFIFARLLVTVGLREESANRFITALGNYAGEREISVAESYARHHKTFASKQLSIFDLYGVEIAEEPEECEEPIAEEPKEDVKAPMISDEAIYESIFGTMPPKPEEKTEEPKEEPVDERAAEEIADELLSSVDDAVSALNEEKETDI